MRREVVIAVCVLVALLPLTVVAKSKGGKFTGIRQVLNASEKDKSNRSCESLPLYKNGRIYLSGKGTTGKIANNVTVLTTVTILKSRCANFAECRSPDDLLLSPYISDVASFTFSNTINNLQALGFTIPTPKSGLSERDDNNSSDMTPSKTSIVPKISETTTPPGTAEPHMPRPDTSEGDLHPRTRLLKVNSSGLYVVVIVSQAVGKAKDTKVELTFNLEMINGYGYLSAIDYPALVFYGVMTAVYAILGIVWSIAMCLSYKDLVRLQFWVFAVIILGFLEKMFFVSEYSSINSGQEPSYLILLAEAISAAKRALARVLLIIVSLGFGTVKPRLGDSLGKVVAVGIIYFIFALIDGIVRAKADSYDTQNTSQIVTLALLFIMDSIIFYWIFTSLVSVRRALRLRKNYVKLSMYNHFAYTLIFAILAALGFTIWMFVEVNFPKDGCLADWQEVWLRDCFWHLLFCFVLIVIMIIWRPSANKNRFAYSLVNDLEQEDEMEEEVENKNFDTLKMRNISRTETTPPPVSSQAEDDLRWVEENLPTTAMDKALPLILDSDEEIMNTKFEASKMN